MSLQPGERGMINEILIYAQDGALRGRFNDGFTIRTGYGERLLHQHRLAGLQKRHRHFAMAIRWNENMRALEAIRSKRFRHGSVDDICSPTIREATRRLEVRIDNSRQGGTLQLCKHFCVHARNEPGANETDPRFQLAPAS